MSTTNAIRATRSACSTTLRPGLLDRQPDGSEDDVVARLDGGLPDALAVHGAAVRRVEVAQQEPVAVADELRVAAGDALVVEHDVAVARAPEHDGAPLDHMPAAVPAEHVLLAREIGRAGLARRDQRGLAGGGGLLVDRVGIG